MFVLFLLKHSSVRHNHTAAPVHRQRLSCHEAESRSPLLSLYTTCDEGGGVGSEEGDGMGDLQHNIHHDTEVTLVQPVPGLLPLTSRTVPGLPRGCSRLLSS